MTSGLPYRFLNDLELDGRLAFYGTNLGAGLAVLAAFLLLAWGISRLFPRPAAP